MADDTSYDTGSAKAAAKTGNKGPKEKSLPQKARKMLQPAYRLNGLTYTDQIQNTDATPAAPWFKPDEHDDIIELKKQYLQNPASVGSSGPLGELTVDKDDLEALKRKKDQEAYLRELSLGQLLIADDPALRQISAEKAYKIYPELQTVPEEAHKKYVGIQASIRTILRDGIIRGKDDNRLFLTMLEPTYMLPLFPLWDMDGRINLQKYRMTLLTLNNGIPDPSNASFADYLNIKYEPDIGVIYGAVAIAGNRRLANLKEKQKRRRGLFNPIRYQVDTTDNEMYQITKTVSYERNRTIKFLIMKRLYPQLKNLNIADVENTWGALFAERKSMFEGGPPNYNAPAQPGLLSWM